MTVEEKKDLCSRALIGWVLSEQDGKDYTVHDEDIKKLFTSQVILKKFEVFGIRIVLPDPLLLILYLCVEGNPGQYQIILKDLLNSIKQRKGPIPTDYIITADDFSMCFMTNFPIIDIPSINDKYRKLWDGQKFLDMSTGHTANACDTIEWWKEVMR